MISKFFHSKTPTWIPAVLALALGFGVFAWISSFPISPDLSFLKFKEDKKQVFEYGIRPELREQKFFEETKARFLENKTDFIEADLSSMILRVYKGGIAVKEVKILAKGREGSWWETPAGLYQAEAKIKNHFSGFAKVYLPWSMIFQGNFFIHGWPYYPDGRPVESTYSGGCIRLSTEDAEEVYKMTSAGTPILVYEKDFSPDDFTYDKNAVSFPGTAYLAADLKNNFVFFEKNKSEPFPIASITKLMTGLVSTEYLNLDKKITVSEDMIIHTSKPRLIAGRSVSIYNLLFPLLLESSNESALAISNILGPKRALEIMKKKASALGMAKTTFGDTSGISDLNVSSPEDLFTLAKYLYNNRSFILRITAGKLTISSYGTPGFKNLSNFNLFSGDPRFIGGKVGKTPAAGETFLGVFELDINGTKRPVAVILLGSDERMKETIESMLGWIHANYSTEP